MKIRALILTGCPLCWAENYPFDVELTDCGVEIEQTTMGMLDTDPNRYTTAVGCSRGHRYTVVVSNGRKMPTC